MKLYLLLLAGLMLGASGCTVHARTVPASATVATYEPLYYDGYTVYYDEFGTPFYYVDGHVRFVPRSYVGFNVYVDHYHRHRPAYRSWYRREGGRHMHIRKRHTTRPHYRHHDRHDRHDRRDRPRGRHRH